jgi:C1A family cysteine protease
MVRGMREYMLKRRKEDFVQLSPLYLYYTERELEGTINEDAGAFLRDGMKLLQSDGVCPEADHPYVVSDYAKAPSAQARANASKYKIAEYHRVDTFDQVKQALADGNPVAMGFVVYSSLMTYNVALTGEIPLPNIFTESVLGGHCVLIVGYRTVDGVDQVKIRNSWGKDWGQSGYGWMTRDYFDMGLVMDLWVGLDRKTEQSVTFDQAIQILVSKGIFSSPDFWARFEAKSVAGALKNADYANVLTGFIKISSYVGSPVASFADAIAQLVKLEIFNSPDYWLGFQKKYLAGTLTNSDCANVMLGFRKLALYVNDQM